MEQTIIHYTCDKCGTKYTSEDSEKTYSNVIMKFHTSDTEFYYHGSIEDRNYNFCQSCTNKILKYLDKM